MTVPSLHISILAMLTLKLRCTELGLNIKNKKTKNCCCLITKHIKASVPRLIENQNFLNLRQTWRGKRSSVHLNQTRNRLSWAALGVSRCLSGRPDRTPARVYWWEVRSQHKINAQTTVKFKWLNRAGQDKPSSFLQIPCSVLWKWFWRSVGSFWFCMGWCRQPHCVPSISW